MDLREAFIGGLIEAGRSDARIVVLDPDVSRTSKSRKFRDQYPGRFYDVGVAEQNTIGIASGLATTGLVPFTIGFAIFLTLRACEQIRTDVCYAGSNVKVVGGYAGLSNFKDGATHQSIEDLAILNAMPGLTIFAASDPATARAAGKRMLAISGPTYLRLEYGEFPDLERHDPPGSVSVDVLRDGKDLTIAATGTAVHRALKAAEILSKNGIEAEVLDFLTLKPFPEEALAQSVQKTGALLTVEDHNRHGGLSAMCCVALARRNIHVAYGAVNLDDVFTESARGSELLAKYHLDAQDIVEAAHNIIKVRGSNHGK